MVKFKAKNLVTVIFLGTLLIGLVGIANAQQTLPKGGDSFETAVELKQGSYEGSSLENNEVGYFYVSGIKPGQEINVKGTFTAVSSSSGALGVLGLYSEDRIKLVKELVTSHDKPESFTISWLPNTDEISYKYYILAGSDTFKIASHSLDISLVERYDAGSQTDAGDSFEKAMSAVLGEYTAYLSGKLGTDTKDFYNMAVEKGATLTVKVTPPSEAIMEVVIYDGNREVLKDESAPNPGAIVTNSISIAKKGNVFVAVICDKYCNKNLTAYTLSISGEGVSAGEEVVPPVGDGGAPPAIGEDGEAAKKGLNWLLILGIIAAIIIIGIVLYFALKKKKK